MDSQQGLVIDFDSDIRYIYLKSLIQNIGYALAHHIDLWLKYSQAREPDTLQDEPGIYGNFEMSYIWNNFFPVDQKVVKTNVELKEDEYKSVIETLFKALTTGDNQFFKTKIASFQKDQLDIDIIVFWFYSPLFLPARVQVESLPATCYKETLLKWVNLIFVMPFSPKCISKYTNVIKELSELESLINKIRMKPEAVNDFKSKPYSYSSTFVSYVGDMKAGTKLIKKALHLAIVTSSTIITYWSPMPQETKAINPRFNGHWTNPIDNIIREQMERIDKTLRDCNLF